MPRGETSSPLAFRQIATAAVMLLLGGGGATVAHRSLQDTTPTVADVRRMIATEAPYLADRARLISGLDEQGELWTDLQQLRSDVAAIKTDIQWIRAALAEGRLQ